MEGTSKNFKLNLVLVLNLKLSNFVACERRRISGHGLSPFESGEKLRPEIRLRTQAINFAVNEFFFFLEKLTFKPQFRRCHVTANLRNSLKLCQSDNDKDLFKTCSAHSFILQAEKERGRRKR